MKKTALHLNISQGNICYPSVKLKDGPLVLELRILVKAAQAGGLGMGVACGQPQSNAVTF